MVKYRSPIIVLMLSKMLNSVANMISFSNKITVPSYVLINAIGGESVILSLETGRYFGLDQVGTGIWSTVTTSDSIQMAYERLLAEYEVRADTLHRDLSDLIEKLADNGLVEITEA